MRTVKSQNQINKIAIIECHHIKKHDITEYLINAKLIEYTYLFTPYLHFKNLNIEMIRL